MPVEFIYIFYKKKKIEKKTTELFNDIYLKKQWNKGEFCILCLRLLLNSNRDYCVFPDYSSLNRRFDRHRRRPYLDKTKTQHPTINFM